MISCLLLVGAFLIVALIFILLLAYCPGEYYVGIVISANLF